MVLKTNLEPFREPLKFPPVGQPKDLIFSSKSVPDARESPSKSTLNEDLMVYQKTP